MFSGFGKGLWTGVLKPTAGMTAGMLDLASRSSLGIANAVPGPVRPLMAPCLGLKPAMPHLAPGARRSYAQDARIF